MGRLMFDVRKFCVLRDLARLPGGMGTVEEIARKQGEKENTIRRMMNHYSRFGYVRVIAKLPREEGGKGRYKKVYEITDYGRGILKKMEDLVAAGFPPDPYHYKLLKE
jgi:predicted ArsR family transcriptional regulator